MELIRNTIWFGVPNEFTISDVIDKIKELHNVEIDSMLVNTYLTRMDKAGLILKHGRCWKKSEPIDVNVLKPDLCAAPNARYV